MNIILFKFKCFFKPNKIKKIICSYFLDFIKKNQKCKLKKTMVL